MKISNKISSHIAFFDKEEFHIILRGNGFSFKYYNDTNLSELNGFDLVEQTIEFHIFNTTKGVSGKFISGQYYEHIFDDRNLEEGEYLDKATLLENVVNREFMKSPSLCTLKQPGLMKRYYKNEIEHNVDYINYRFLDIVEVSKS